MGITFNGRHSDEFGVPFRTVSIPIIPLKRQTKLGVQGRDGEYIFEDGYGNIEIELAGTIPGYEIIDRRKKARQIAAWLSATGKLIFDYEKDVEYQVVKVTNDIDASMFSRQYKDEFTVIFECKPYQNQTFYNDSLTWDEAKIPWKYLDIPWEGYARTFEASSGQTIEVVNAGTYKALPIINLTGNATSITIQGFNYTTPEGIIKEGSLTFNNLSGTVYIDCDNQVVYSLSGTTKVNKILDFDGDFPELLPGANQFEISGTITSLTIEFDYKNTYL